MGLGRLACGILLRAGATGVRTNGHALARYGGASGTMQPGGERGLFWTSDLGCATHLLRARRPALRLISYLPHFAEWAFVSWAGRGWADAVGR